MSSFRTSLPKMGGISNLMTLVLILIAGLMGASGVALAAAAAHAKSGMRPDLSFNRPIAKCLHKELCNFLT
jgi:hypothetical protein